MSKIELIHGSCADQVADVIVNVFSLDKLRDIWRESAKSCGGVC